MVGRGWPLTAVLPAAAFHQLLTAISHHMHPGVHFLNAPLTLAALAPEKDGPRAVARVHATLDPLGGGLVVEVSPAVAT